MSKGLGKSRGLFRAYQTPAFFHIAQVLPRDAQLAGKRRLGYFFTHAQRFHGCPERQGSAQYPPLQVRA